MCAWIEGMVLEAISGNSFRLKIKLSDEENQFQYKKIERIRMRGIETPDLRTYEGLLARQRLNSRLQNKMVRCNVVLREPDDFLLCEIRPLK